MSLKPLLVSACLLGIPCRWHGRKIRPSRQLQRYLDALPECEVVSVCPETLAGFPIPRPAVKRKNGRVYQTCAEKANRKNVTGEDVTEQFLAGAKATLEIAQSKGCTTAVLCAWSPSCDKNGVTGKILTANGIEVVNVF
ncbi:MAG: DUF523 domain-containing protein [Dehalococcoidia bacterium]|nr:DUF523 domain-containing protein [Dehalococcoidia bacterium]